MTYYIFSESAGSNLVNERYCNIPSISNASFKPSQVKLHKKLREQSFLRNGSLIFNNLPSHIRSVTNCSVDDFKAYLDSYISKIHEELKIDGLLPHNLDIQGVHSNSLLTRSKHL